LALSEKSPDTGDLSEIDLRFLAELTFPTAERKLQIGAVSVDEAFDPYGALGQGDPRDATRS
jgi:hypothetical protein